MIDNNFELEINFLENLKFDKNYICKLGLIPILFVAAHTMRQTKEDGTIKYEESYTKSIAMYINKFYGTSYFIKIKDTGIDSNKDNNDSFKKDLLKFVKDNNIKFVIDLHGARRDREFDVEFGTLNNLTADFSSIKELEEAFIENGENNIKHNNPFKGGAITQYLYGIDDVEVIQLEINKKYRDKEDIQNLNKICKSLISFIKQYIKYTNR